MIQETVKVTQQCIHYISPSSTITVGVCQVCGKIYGSQGARYNLILNKDGKIEFHKRIKDKNTNKLND